MANTLTFKIKIALIVVGFSLSAYLAWRSYQLMSGEEAGPDLCSIAVKGSCDSTILLDNAKQLGLPLAAWGAIYFLGLALVAFLRKSFVGIPSRMLFLILNSFGCGISLYLAYRIVSLDSGICLLCLATHAINFSILGMTAFSLSARVTNGESQESALNQPKGIVAVIAAGLLVGLISQHGLWVWSGAVKPELVLARFRAEPVREIPIGTDDARVGTDDARIRIVVFSSFFCPGCRAVGRTREHLLAQYRDQIEFTYKHFPLEKRCNPKLPHDIYANSCLAAKGAIAAAEQDKFWDFSEAIDGHHSIEPSDLQAIAVELDLDLQEWKKSFESEATTTQLQSDIELGHRLEIRSTPAIFLNGRRVRRNSLGILNLIIKDELEKATR